MDKTEYSKKNVLHVKFPSGLELDIGLPNAYEFLYNPKFSSENIPDSEALQELIKMLKFPSGWSFEDLNLTDGLYLTKVINDLFTKILQPPSGS